MEDRRDPEHMFKLSQRLRTEHLRLEEPARTRGQQEPECLVVLPDRKPPTPVELHAKHDLGDLWVGILALHPVDPAQQLLTPPQNSSDI